MNELYLANRNLSELYRHKLQEKIFILDQSKIFSDQAEINPQVYYLDFKDRVLEFVFNETEILKKECLKSDNSHLILLKQTALVDTIVQAAFTSAIWFFNQQNNQSLTQETAPLFILARGGYGREEMYFRSDVDIQIISAASLDDEKKKWGKQITFHFEYLFIHQDFFPVSRNSCYTENESFDNELNQESITGFISLLEHRFVTGNNQTYKEFTSSIQTTSLLNEDKIIKHCLSHGGYYEIQNTVFKQEPDIKEELQRLYWALTSVRIIQKIEKTNQYELLNDLYAKNLISPLAFKSMKRDSTFSLR